MCTSDITIYHSQEKSPSTKEIDELINLDVNYFQNPWKQAVWDSVWEQSLEYALVVLNCGRETIGFALYRVIESDHLGHMLKLIIHPDHRKKGYAKEIINQSISYFKSIDIERICLEVSTKNEAAIGLYKQFGFEESRYIKNFYDQGIDALSLIKNLG